MCRQPKCRRKREFSISTAVRPTSSPCTRWNVSLPLVSNGRTRFYEISTIRRQQLQRVSRQQRPWHGYRVRTRALVADDGRSAEALVPGDLVGGEYGYDKGQTTQADEPAAVTGNGAAHGRPNRSTDTDNDNNNTSRQTNTSTSVTV